MVLHLHRYYLDYDCRPSGPRACGASSSACPLDDVMSREACYTEGTPPTLKNKRPVTRPRLLHVPQPHPPVPAARRPLLPVGAGAHGPHPAIPRRPAATAARAAGAHAAAAPRGPGRGWTWRALGGARRQGLRAAAAAVGVRGGPLVSHRAARRAHKGLRPAGRAPTCSSCPSPSPRPSLR